MFLFSFLFIIQLGFVLFCFAGWWVSLYKGLCWFIPGVAMGIPCATYLLTFGLLNVSQAGLVPASGGTGALLFSRCNVE
jgi:hypothetical protein